jgi:hypothetical protein
MRELAAAALLAAGLLTSRPALAAHDAAGTSATPLYCNVFPEPLTFADTGQPVACDAVRLTDPVPTGGAGTHRSAQRQARDPGSLAACARPGYGAMLRCPLWH